MDRRLSKKFSAAFRSSSGAGDEEEEPRAPGCADAPGPAAAPVKPATMEPLSAPSRAGPADTLVHVDLTRQRLELRVRGETCGTWPVSTAVNGPGERQGSECTPRGRHVIRARIGAGAPSGAVFVARRPTGERYTPALGAAHPGRDWILTRILWLSGTEPGRNRLGDVDTMRRYIYIHGCPDDADVTTPGSHGCIRMRNADVIDLFDRVEAGTPVVIEA